MATYKGIKGIPIETIAGDPANPIEGQVWYNSSSNDMKCYKYVVGTGAWASATASPVAHTDGGGAGSQTAYLAISGYIGGQAGAGNQAYDGTNWTTVNSLVQPRYACTGSFGTNTAAITAGGPDGTSNWGTEIYDGTSWTITSDFNRTTGYNAMGGAGTSTAGLIFNGNPGNVVLTETWDGTSWAETNDQQNGSHGPFAIGTQTAALQAGGNIYPAPYTKTSETWDGTSWTEVNDLNTGRGKGCSSGTSTAGLVAGGNANNPGSDLTEIWDGTSWTEVADMGTGRYQDFGSPGGTSLLALTTGGAATGSPAASVNFLVEEWTDPTGNAVKTFTDS